ncbi:uncharacterized protein LOC125648968 [Ostrea edulis]|uniref:uncharacterized protein LOC125648968 n=1 Tax=Ostrea edulis TaxID=37623 RepID=UPI00209437E2|nr:uncharacterized protein LOC125648968 [Ostrea edulis]
MKNVPLLLYCASVIGRCVLGLTCLRCSDITEPRLCNKIERCQNGEVCAVQQYRADNGDIGYWTGCYPQKECGATDNRTVITTKRSQYIDGVVQCRDCCTTDICNAYGCGTPKYPDTRGPICFDCEDVADPTDCHTITPCDLNQKCLIHERNVFEQKYFTSKCEPRLGCSSLLSGPVVGRRRDLLGVCIHCCDGDLCNANCSSASRPTVPVTPNHVAFHAVAYSSTSSGVIIFDHVITNIGGGYDNVTGVFTVPTTGSYVFSWTIETYGQRTEGALLVNGMQEGLLKAHQSSSNYDTTTSFAVLNLTLTDKVSVRVITGRAEARHTMFSGWKINKTDDTAFDASLSRDVSGSHIKYDNKTLDTDNAYYTSTGNFVAPRSGLYVFMMSALNYGNYAYNCRFQFSNGNSQPDVWVDSRTGYYDSASYMTFAWLDVGDNVYVNAPRMRTTSVFAGWQLVDNMRVSKSTYPAFLASLSGDFSGTPVVFGSTHSGYHHGYSTTTGIFTADRDGVYVFLYNIEAQSEIVRAALNVNGIDKFETRSDGRNNGYDDSSALSVLQLSSGDKVSVERKYGTVDGGQSMFFGVLLFEV